jgi:hypothetical protein
MTKTGRETGRGWCPAVSLGPFTPRFPLLDGEGRPLYPSPSPLEDGVAQFMGVIASSGH